MKAVTNTSFSSDLVRGDAFIDQASIAVASLAGTDTPGQRLADIQSALEVVIEADSDLTIGTTALVFKLQKCATKGGSYTDVETLYTSVTSGTVSAGILVRKTISIVDDYFYKVVATSAVSNAGTVSAYPHVVAR